MRYVCSGCETRFQPSDFKGASTPTDATTSFDVAWRSMPVMKRTGVCLRYSRSGCLFAAICIQSRAADERMV